MRPVLKYGPLALAALVFAVCLFGFAVTPKNNPVATAWAWRSLGALAALFLAHWWAAR